MNLNSLIGGESPLFGKALSFSSCGIVITDREGTIVYANPAIEKICGYTPEELIGQKPSIFKSGVHSNSFYQDLWNTIESGSSFVGAMVNRHKDGHDYCEEATINPILDNSGAITHYVAIKNDVTEQRRLEEELRNALSDAQEVNRVKSNLMARISHELRTPMNGILGMSQLLDDTDLDSEQKEMNSIIYSSSCKMMEVVNNLIELQNLEKGETYFTDMEFRLREVLEVATQKWIAHAAKKGLLFEVKAESVPSQRLYGDAERLVRVLSILIENSCKFSDQGRIVLSISCKNRENKAEYTFEVLDEGIGISDEKREMIFEAFRQENEEPTRRYEGLGVGLTIAKRIVDAAGGEIGLKRQQDGFTCFWFTMTFDIRPTEPQATVGSGEKMAALRVLVCDDDEGNRLVFKRMLQNLGHDVVSVGSGRETLVQLESSSFDLLLLDCRMPGMDGFETAKQIRKLHSSSEDENFRIPIIAVSADLADECRRDFASAGIDAFLTKPVERDVLKAALVRVGTRKV